MIGAKHSLTLIVVHMFTIHSVPTDQYLHHFKPGLTYACSGAISECLLIKITF